MNISKKKTLINILLSICIIILISCTPQRKYEILSFFFDGVPNPNIDSTLIVVKTSDSTLFKSKKRPPKKPKITMVIHSPYKERACADCHNLYEGNKLVEKIPELCYQCHDDMSEEFSYLHGPVATGFCPQCHHPHMSKNKKLLTRIGQDVCLFCHVQEDVFKNDAHEDIGKSNCWECHNPHGGSDRFLLE